MQNNSVISKKDNLRQIGDWSDKIKMDRYWGLMSNKKKGVYELEYIILMSIAARGLVQLDSIINTNFDDFGGGGGWEYC